MTTGAKSTVRATRGREAGFTLLELLVAVSVFAFVSALAYGGVRAVLDARAHTDQASRALAGLQMAMTLLGRDLGHVVARPVRDVYGDPQAPLSFSIYSDHPRLELVRTSARHGLQRVAWELREGRLYRLYWTVIDGANPAEPQGRLPVLGPQSGADAGPTITDWALRFHYRDNGAPAVSDSWPLEIASGALDELPLAVELALEVQGTGRVTRWFAVR